MFKLCRTPFRFADQNNCGPKTDLVRTLNAQRVIYWRLQVKWGGIIKKEFIFWTRKFAGV